MREFAFGTDAQFDALERELSGGKKYKFADRQLPRSCSVPTADLWFAKEEPVYCVYIEKGISTSTENPVFRNFLKAGRIAFPCMEDMKEFFGSLQPLFGESAQQADSVRNPALMSLDEQMIRLPSEAREVRRGGQGVAADVVDKQKLREIQESEEKRRIVWPEELAEPLKKKVFGQDAVIDALADKVVINQMRKNKKLLVLALLGPTGTGKSETAKSLAEVMTEVYETRYGFIELAGNEFVSEHMVNRFFGAPPGYVGHGQATVLEPIRKNPHHVIVIDEVEKADEKLLVGLMEAIDTGKLGMADNSEPIDLNQCILLFTSNIPINMERYENASEFERAEMCRDVFTKHCGRPEISGKIGNFLAFQPLGNDARSDIIVKFIREELEGYDLRLGHIDEYLMADFLKHQTKYGARGIRGMVSDSVGRHLLRARKLEEFAGKEVSMCGTIDSIKFSI